MGGPENHPSAFVLFLVLLVFRLLTSTTPAPGAEVKEGFSFFISTCLRETRNSRLVSLCVFTVHLCISVCVYGGYSHITPTVADLLSVVDGTVAGAGFSCFP